MNATNKTKFYELLQKKTCGFWETDDNVCYRIIIEAKNKKQATSILTSMIGIQDNPCPKCGYRWLIENINVIDLEKIKKEGYNAIVYSHFPNVEERWFKQYGEYPKITEPTWKALGGTVMFNGIIYFETIEQYCLFMTNEQGCIYTTPDTRIYFLDGTKKEIFQKDFIS